MECPRATLALYAREEGVVGSSGGLPISRGCISSAGSSFLYPVNASEPAVQNGFGECAVRQRGSRLSGDAAEVMGDGAAAMFPELNVV